MPADMSRNKVFEGFLNSTSSFQYSLLFSYHLDFDILFRPLTISHPSLRHSLVDQQQGNHPWVDIIDVDLEVRRFHHSVFLSHLLFFTMNALGTFVFLCTYDHFLSPNQCFFFYFFMSLLGLPTRFRTMTFALLQTVLPLRSSCLWNSTEIVKTKLWLTDVW